MKTVCVCLSLVLMAWALTARATAAWIVLSSDRPERVVACLPLQPGVPFHLEFINSIYRAPVRETFVYEPGEGLFVIRIESPSAGVFEYYGLIPEKSGVSRMKRKLDEIRILTSDYENHRLTVGKTTLRLKGLVADGEPIVLRIKEGKGCDS